MATPMQQQYDEIKQKFPGAILLFRLGDFYETFDQDAQIASRVLNITLTGRGVAENRRPMAGIPFHALPNYLPKLLAAGQKVVIVDQTTQPQPGKLVEREVVAVLSPGVINDANLLNGGINNFLAAVNIVTQKRIRSAYVCISDVSTQELFATYITNIDEELSELRHLLNKYQIKELLCNETAFHDYRDKFSTNSFHSVRTFNYAPDIDFSTQTNLENLKTQWGINSFKRWGISDHDEVIGTIHALKRYLADNFHQSLTADKLTLLNNRVSVNIPWNTYSALEVFRDNTGNLDNSLVNHLDQCLTPGGKRLLHNWILNATRDIGVLKYRHDSIELMLNSLVNNNAEVAIQLGNQPDYLRLITKIKLGKALPHDLLAISGGIIALKDLQAVLTTAATQADSTIVNKLVNLDITKLAGLAEVLRLALNTGIHNLSEPGFINPQFDIELAKLEEDSSLGKEYLRNLEQREIAASGIASLKVRYNKVFGYYIEISKSNLAKVPANYIRKQTLVNAERYITEELKQWEEKIYHMADFKLKRELEIFTELFSRFNAEILISLQEVADYLSEFDVLYGFTNLTHNYNYIRPRFTDRTNLRELKHPVLGRLLKEKFISNDLSFDKACVHLITGPNMAGKSTFIRSVAIAQLMAQIGCFVPASEAEMEITDGIFTRVGASDNLSQNESTFMVEMSEMSYILQHATKDSLIILDEVGRGTSTYDGVALAWSIVEYIANTLQAKCLFATHYHELIELEKLITRVKNYYVEVIPGEALVFTHKVKPGSLSKSFGISVAQLAGLHKSVVSRAREVLQVLESENNIKKASKQKLNYAQLTLKLNQEN